MGMNTEIKAQWVAALRSGEYEQTKGTLRDPVNNSFCCLGVLCDLAVKDGLTVEVIEDRARPVGFEKTSYDGNEDTLPESVRAWAGLNNDNPSMSYVNGYDEDDDDSLAELNDGGRSFAEIADLIEDQL